LTVKFLSADFAAASKNSGKNSCCLLKIDITSVMDANENEHYSRRHTVVFCFGDEEKILEIFVHKHYAHTHSVYVSYDVITTTTTTTV